MDVRDLGGHLDFTRRARAGTLSTRVRQAALGVAAVGALPFGFSGKVGAVLGVSVFLLASMLLKYRVYPPRPLVLFGLLLFGQCWLLRCLLPTPLPFLIFLMVLLGLILLSMLSGPGSV